MAGRGPRGIVSLLGGLGRSWGGFVGDARVVLRHFSGMWVLFRQTLYYSFVGPFTGRTRLRQSLFHTMRSVGVRSFPIVFLISFLIGAILVIQLGPMTKRLGQTAQIPMGVAVTMCRELGPLMTAIVLVARVGASFTAVLASMKINEEVTALETMAINPVGYLVAPRFLSMLIMTPCLTVLSYLIGMLGGALVANQLFDLGYAAYAQGTIEGLDMEAVASGLIKAVVFAVFISITSCYFGLITEGGSIGLGRHTMVSVVSCLVIVIVTDALMGAFFVQYGF
jgi:phospholipid/cholesterol/gamma-HCH transport system permease protein